MIRRFRTIIFLLLIAALIGCQDQADGVLKDNRINTEQIVDSIEIVTWAENEPITIIKDQKFIDQLEEKFAAAKTFSTAAMDFATPDYRLLFKQGEETISELGYYNEVINLGIEGQYWDPYQDLLYGVTFPLPILTVNNPTKPYHPDDAIQNGDVVNVHGKITNFDRFESFLDHLLTGKKDNIRFTMYTTEGDPIFYNLDYDGQKIRYTFDDSQDAFDGSDKGQKSTICTNIKKTATENAIEYYLSGCDSEVGNSFYFHVPK